MDKRIIRYWIPIMVIAAFTLFIVWRFAYLAYLGPVASKARSVERIRGTIMDRDGRILAVESSLYNIAVWRPELDKTTLNEDCAFIADILSDDAGKMDAQALAIVSKIQSSPSDFLYIAKRVSTSVARAIQDGRRQGRLPGFVIERVAGRIYPEKRLASNVIGFIGDEGYGLTGIESRFESDLAPPLVAKAASSLNPDEAAVIQGNGIILAIDSNLQHEAEKIALEAFDSNKAESVILLVSQVDTGEIVSYVSLPNFDPNDFLAFPASSYTDLPATYMFEPGSVMKVFSLSSILETGAIDTRTRFICTGAYERTAPSGEKIVIKCMGVHGSVSITEILRYSCNAGAMAASDHLSSLDFYDMLKRFGFGAKTGIPLPGESYGYLAKVQDWSLRTKPTIAFGQEIGVTSLQIIQAASAVANSGMLMKPILVKQVLSPDGSLLRNQSPVGQQVISAQTARSILDSMEAASQEGGSGSRVRIPDVRISVKTGTSQMVDPKTGKYSPDDFIASCLAIFPTDAPRYIIYMAIIKPRGISIHGGLAAAPFIRDIAERVITRFGVPRGNTSTVVHPGTIVIPQSKNAIIGNTMPDLSGFPKRLLIPLLSRTDISVSIEGDGYVVSQSPSPGEPVLPGTPVRLILR